MSHSRAYALRNLLGSAEVLKMLVLTAISSLLCIESRAGRVTHQNPDGNRIAAGNPTDIHSLSPLDIPLIGTPLWLVSETYKNGVLWVAVLEDGTVQGIKVANGAFVDVDIQPAKLPAGMPPLLLGREDAIHCWSPPPDASILTHGVVIGGGKNVAYIDLNGQLVIPNDLGSQRLSVDALPDTRILVDDRDRMLLLTNPTRRYLHGVLGDSIEAASFTIVDTDEQPRVVTQVSVGDAEVIEATSLLWVDVTGDQRREIVATVSAPGLGARIRMYHESGEILAEGPAIGRSFRWRNQAAFFQDPQTAKRYLTDVLTPHIGGTLEFFEWDGAGLNLEGSHFGVTSHRIGSRNLDWALVGPFGLRDHFVMVQPNDGRTHLVAVGIEDGAAVHHWNVPMGGEIRTNLSSANTPSDQVALGVGTSNNRLRIWQPEERKPYLNVATNDAGNPQMHVVLHGHPDARYQIQSSHDLQEWESIGEVVIRGETGVDISLLLPPGFGNHLETVPPLPNGCAF